MITLSLLLALAAPLPFAKPDCGTFETPYGYVLRMEADGRASYGRGYHPGVSLLDHRWRETEGGVLVWREGSPAAWFARWELRRVSWK